MKAGGRPAVYSMDHKKDMAEAAMADKKVHGIYVNVNTFKQLHPELCIKPGTTDGQLMSDKSILRVLKTLCYDITEAHPWRWVSPKKSKKYKTPEQLARRLDWGRLMCGEHFEWMTEDWCFDNVWRNYLIPKPFKKKIDQLQNCQNWNPNSAIDQLI